MENIIDLDVLPPNVREQLVDYYQYLIQRHNLNIDKEFTFSEKEIEELDEITLEIDPLIFQKRIRDEW